MKSRNAIVEVDATSGASFLAKEAIVGSTSPHAEEALGQKKVSAKSALERESKESNDLFFTCSLIDYIARKTKNHRSDVVNALGKNAIARIYDLADVYHSDNIDDVSDSFIEESGLEAGSFDNVASAKYSVPSHWDLGKVYKRLILGIARTEQIGIVDALFKAYNSFASEKIEDFNSSFYYDAPQNILNAYLYGTIE